VGPSGSGKTTLLEVLAGFRRPDSGRILVDGNDLRLCDVESYRAQLGYVTQETVLFHDTLRSNITFLRPEAKPEEIDRALSLAEAREFVTEHGLEAVGGERGAKISGGQRQRIALARALLQDPPVLLLDEATNALDLATEARVFDNLLDARRDKIIVVAAHRLSALTRFDSIVVLHRGRVIEQGSHAQLLAARGFYYHLFGLQEFSPEMKLDALAQLS
jgi:subfamily B ATP-binding cassette protein MsbA